MYCSLCDAEIEIDEAYVPVLANHVPDDAGYGFGGIARAPADKVTVNTGGIHVECLLGALREALTGPPEGEVEEPQPLESYAEVGYCDVPGCINKVYSAPEGPQCAAGHQADPLAQPYREGDQD